jgi:hypothetical protein
MVGLVSPGNDVLRAGLLAFTWGGTECVGHTGYWGTAAFTCPELELTIAYAWGQAALGETDDPLAIGENLVEAYVAAEG